MKNYALATMVFLLSMTATSTLSFTDTSGELHNRIDNAPHSHPRLFFYREDVAKIKLKISADPLLKSMLDYIVSCSEAMLQAPPLERKLEGKRLLSVSRTCLRRVSYLSFAYLMTDDKRFLKRAEQEMLAMAEFEDWNPKHFLDVAEMSAALAIGYDWLYNDLSPKSRTLIRDAIVEKGLKTSQGLNLDNWWIMTTNNWNQVCHGGLTLGALATLEDNPELSEKIIARAIQYLPFAMKEYEPDGVYPEGPSYWAYGTSYNVLLIAALESVLKSDFNLASAKGFMKSPDFFLRATGPTGMFYNFSDCSPRGDLSPAMYWFAAHTKNNSLLWREKSALENIKSQEIQAEGSADRLLPLLLVWATPLKDFKAPAQLNWKGDGRTPVALLRTGWFPDSHFLGIKGGSPGSNHAHMDIGSFVLDLNGVRWAVDLGAQNYNSLESKGIDLWNRGQDSQRWTVFRLNNYSHNTLTVDGKLQKVEATAEITRFSGDGNAFAIVDMSPTYEGQLQHAERGARLFGSAVLIQDEVTALDQECTVQWGMTTQAQVTLSADKHRVTLAQDGKELILQVLSPTTAELSVLDVEKPPQDYDAANPNTRRIIFEIKLAAKSTETIRVFMNAGTSPAPMPPAESLSEWQ